MALNRTQTLIVVSLCVIGTIAVYFAGKKPSTGSTLTETPFAFEPQAWALPDPTPNDAQDYKDLLVKLEAERVTLASRYQQAASSSQQADVLAQARTFVTRFIYNEIFPAWYGTAWDFYGTTEVPQQGKIACGYFVSTVASRCRLAGAKSAIGAASLRKHHHEFNYGSAREAI